MKHTLPILTITALAAAASAQVAPAAKQSLSYNRIVASWVSTSNGTVVGMQDVSYEGMSVFAQAKIGAGFYVSATVSDLNTSGMIDAVEEQNDAALGWAYSLPSVLGVATDLNIELGYKSAGAGLRALIGGGLEIDLAYTHGAGAIETDVFTVGASFNLGFLVKGLSVNAAYASETSELPWRSGLDTTSIGIGYNF